MIKSFTLLEILIVILIFLVLFSITFPFFYSQREKPSLDVLYSLLHRARLKALAGFQDSSWGVKITQEQATLFKGESYEQRDPGFDRNYNIYSSEVKEFVFEKNTGFNQGPAQLMDIYINELGIILLDNYEPTERENIDSRRVSIYYNGFIDLEKKIIFNDQEFLIQDYLENNNLYLEYENILLTTLKINDPNTIFVIKRDRRLNDQALNVYLEQDPNSLIEYSADGLETKHESSFVEKIKWE